MYVNTENEKHKIYAFAHCEAWIENYAKSNNLSISELTSSVADLLQLQASRQILGSKYTMSTLRRKGTKGNKTTRKMEMVGSAYSKTQVKKRKYTRKALHWTQKPENKKKLRKTLLIMKKAREAKLAA